MTVTMDSISTAHQSMLLYDTKAEVLRPWRMSEIEYCQEKTRYIHKPFLAVTYENHAKFRQHFPKLKKEKTLSFAKIFLYNFYCCVDF